MPWIEWYNSLAKPGWTPGPSTIGLIWQILYPIILVSFGFVFVQAFRKKVPWLVALPFAINLVANMIFTPIQFGLKSAAGCCRYLDRVGNNHLDGGRRMATLPLGGSGSGAVRYLGIACDRAATVDHCDELE